MAGPLGLGWSPWRHGRAPGPRVAAVGAWPVSWTPRGRRVGVAIPLNPVWPPWVGAVPLGPALPPLGRGRRGGAGDPLGPRLPPWGRGRSPSARVVAVGARPVPWGLCGHCVGVAGTLEPVWPLWGRGRSSRYCVAAFGPRVAAVGA